MEKHIIEVKNIGKKYNISHQRGGYIALRDVLMNVIRSPFSFLKSKAKQITGLEKKEDFWALQDISFNVKKGEVVGVIGANGAGKSTLLKILSQITPPTTGEIILRGRVGSLLEVGTGFHPELTGRENIFLNGAILGMKRSEIARKFDEIVEFAGIEKFLDTPVKYYSSGMYVRLAFSVAAHMEPDILIIDEVLAVGDAEFQKKCLGKMESITKSEGRTILFVSHNMGAIKKLCSKTILLNRGRIVGYGATEDIVKMYMSTSKSSSKEDIGARKDRKGTGDLKVVDCCLQTDGTKKDSVASGEDVSFILDYECKANAVVGNVVVGMGISTIYGENAFLCHNQMSNSKLVVTKQTGSLECSIKNLPLVPGFYSLNFRILSDNLLLDEMQNAYIFEVTDGDFFGNGFSAKHSLFYIKNEWKNINTK